MDPATLIAGSLAILFALLAILQWRRATDLEERVRELEGKLLDASPTPKELDAIAAPPPDAEPEAAEPEPEAAAEPVAEPAPEPAAEAEPEPEPEPEHEPMAALPPVEPEDEPLAALPPVEPEPPAEPPRPAEPDPLRLEALKVVAEAFELARYLDFDFIVEKPSTFRVTVPLTASNGKAVRYLEDGMFPCLKQVRVEDSQAILHIDTAKGPP